VSAVKEVGCVELPDRYSHRFNTNVATLLHGGGTL